MNEHIQSVLLPQIHERITPQECVQHQTMERMFDVLALQVLKDFVDVVQLVPHARVLLDRRRRATI